MNPEFERHLALARHLLAASSHERAARECEAALSLEPHRNDARLLRARCLRGLGRLPQARREVEIALQNRADDVDALYLSSLLAPRRDQALAAIEKALELRPNAAHLHAHLAAVHLRSDGPWFLRVKGGARHKKAENAARAALELNPRDAIAHRYLALALLSQNRVEEARRHVETSLSLHPENPRAHVLLSLLRNTQSDAAGAEAALREALRLDPDNRGLQRDLKFHVTGEQIFGSFDNPTGFKLFNATFGQLPALWRLPALVAAQVASMAALVTIPSGWMKPGDAQTGVTLGLLALLCVLCSNFNLAARPYLALVPQKFLPRELQKWGKSDVPSSP